jgi:hypothetical protein
MSTSTILLVGGLVLAVVIVVQLAPKPVSAADTAISSGAGLLSQLGSWWNKNYEFGT